MNPWRVEPRNNNSARNRTVFALAVVVGLNILPPLSGCQTLEQMAPPVGPDFLVVAAQRGMEPTTLEAGRQLYITDCARCHSVEPISRYSAARWRQILPRMARETKLDDSEKAAVEAYVMTATAFLEQHTKAN